MISTEPRAADTTSPASALSPGEEGAALGIQLLHHSMRVLKIKLKNIIIENKKVKGIFLLLLKFPACVKYMNTLKQHLPFKKKKKKVNFCVSQFIVYYNTVPISDY